MKLIEQNHEIIFLSENSLQLIELAGRTCYKSENRITENSAEKFVTMLRDRKHHAMLEFGIMIVRFITNRGVTHELARHRICSLAQESTRYCNYGNKEMEFIKPIWLDEKCSGICNNIGCAAYSVEQYLCRDFLNACNNAELAYNNLLKNGWTPQQAREVLPNSLKTEIVIQANMREWRHIFTLRCGKEAHPQMRALMISLLEEVKTKIPVLFDDIMY